VQAAATSDWRWQTPSARLAKAGGSTNLISLASIKRVAGERWDKMRESVCSRLEAMFRQRLGPADFFLPIDDTSYLVVMPTASPEEGQICCLRISYELNTSLLGACAVDNLEISMARYLGDDVLEVSPLQRPDIERLAREADLVLSPSASGVIVGQASGTEKARSATSAAAPELEVELSFHPVWDAQYQVIRAYRCVPRKKNIGLPAAQSPSHQTALVTLAGLKLMGKVLENHLANNTRFMLALPVPFEVLTSPLARMEFAATFRRLPGDLRPYLVTILHRLPVGVPHSRLVDLVSSVSPFCRGVIAEVPWNEPRLDDYRGIGLKAIGLDLDNVPAGDVPLALARVCDEAKRTGLLTFLDGVADGKFLRAGLAAGVQWLSGPAVAASVRKPGPLVRLERQTLLNEAAA